MHLNLNRRRFMKKKFLFIPLLATLLCGCTFDDIINKITGKTTENSNQTNTDSSTDSDQTHVDPPQGDVRVTSVTLAKESTSIEEMQSETLSYTVLPINATNKNVTWSTSNSLVATVTNGKVDALNPGTATITVTTVDGSKTDSCEVTVTAKPIEVSTISATFDVTEKYYSKSDQQITSFTLEQEIDENVNLVFSQGTNTTNPPKCFAYNKVSAVRVYPGNQFTISSTENIRKIELSYQSEKDTPSNVLSSNPEGFNVDTWTGSATQVIFTAEDASGNFRAIKSIKVTYEGEGPAPDELINLGVKTIREVKDYIAEHPVKKNAFGNGVNNYRKVTIKGFALAKIDLVKFTSTYGLEVSEPAKVIMADATDYIGVATKTSNDGNTLWGKIDNYVCQSTSKYIVTGYLSEYLGHPEILVESFTWDSSLDITWDASVISEATLTLSEFYTAATNVNYNCAGHGYGQVVTLENLKCYYVESDGQGKRYYNLTDGNKNIRVNAFNLGNLSINGIYNVTGIISMKNLSPIIVAFSITATEDATPVSFDYESIAENISIAELKTIKGSQEDTSTRYPDVVNAFGRIFKTTGYLTAVTENGKLYVGISDSYISRASLITGKDNAMANYGISLIKNENFWNTTEEELYLFNPTFDDYILEDNPITVYYVVRQLRYSSNKPMWEILLLPSFIDSLQPTE